MSAFERILAAADEETMAIVRRMIGKEVLALYIAERRLSGELVLAHPRGEPSAQELDGQRHTPGGVV